ncbi:DUF4349 domain-containing protein [Cryobacterium tepidiphilum]|uniref:DUF4349 domain-containing protein n=1 Tax=Cryobacterium tepidiphilum TaxID=2486026 RepID=A0A3M8KVB7_9MICO|nr:DUF4349 domain-containing protein [Cryobacterium tepidiphilum]RNE57005.1 DUF4349 domain-containing protein [Cryobacterium tepidiphilum]
MRRIVAVTGVLLGALLLSGCTMSDSGSSSDGGSGGSVGMPAPVGPEIGGDSAGGSSGGDTAGGGTVVQRQVVTTGSVSLSADAPLDAADKATKIVEAKGGRVDDRVEQAPTDTQKPSARLTLRIPSDRLTATLAELEKLGETNQVSISSSDVTTKAQDLDARVKALQTSVDRLLSLMAKATDTTDLITIESALSERQAELDSLRAQRDYLSGQVELSTITLDIVATGVAPAGTPGDFWGGLAAGWAALVAFLGGIVVVIGVVLPWAALTAVVVLIVWWIVRAAKRRRTRNAQSEPGSGTTTSPQYTEGH